MSQSELLEKYNEIWGKFTNFIEKRFDSDSVFNDKYLKTKINSYEGKIITKFQDDKKPKEGSQHICVMVILIHSVFKIGKNYYLEMLLEDSKDVVKEEKDI